MTKRYWFASLLTDSTGAWRGRLLRCPDAGNAVDAADPEASSALLDWLPSARADDGELCLPSSLQPEGWVATSDAQGDGVQSVRWGERLLNLNTASDAQWQFDNSGAVLADTGWLLNRSPADKKAGRRSPVQLIHLLAEVEGDADTRQLEQAFRAEPDLSYQLLRMLNSPAFGLRTPVQGLGHAITMLGRRQLQRWLQLLMYAQAGLRGDAPNPLLQLAAYRGHLLEELVRLRGGAEADIDGAYMVGIFSLLDRVIDQPLRQIVDQLPLPSAVREALTSQQGELGQVLALTIASERGALHDAARILVDLAVEPAAWLNAQDTAFRWGYGLGRGGDAAQ